MSAEPERDAATEELLGESPEMRAVRRRIAQVAASDVTVLVQGESGTGKELVARALHRGSARARGPFVPVDCGALDPNLLASELFGHVKGAFTGAGATRPGLFQAAHRGTLFLDEIGNLPLDVQARLLRVLQERRVRPLGGNREREIDVRVVAATNRDLGHAVSARTFRADLYYRVAVVTILLPPLRERPGDVTLLAQHFARRAAERRPGARGDAVKIAPEVLHRLARYHWPGNVRQLSNLVEGAAVLSTDGVIREILLPDAEPPASEDLRLETAVRRAERQAILTALERAGGSRSGAARLLEISRRSLYEKMERLGIRPAPTRFDDDDPAGGAE